jgi:hypothetical protein
MAYRPFDGLVNGDAPLQVLGFVIKADPRKL